VKFGFIAKHRGIWPADWLCGALGVLTPTGDPWRSCDPSAASDFRFWALIDPHPPKFIGSRAGICLRKFCMKFLDPYSSVKEYIARALRHQPQPRSIAPLQRWRGQHEEERRCKAGGPSRIRQMGERSPKRRQEDGRVCLLRILRERKARPSRFPCRRQQMANRSWLASSRRSIERLTPPSLNVVKAFCFQRGIGLAL
jgi:hypothetical protein